MPRKVRNSEGHRPGHSHAEVGPLHPEVPSGAADDDALRAYGSTLKADANGHQDSTSRMTIEYLVG